MADLLQDLWGDIRYALRSIPPLFVVFVVSTLAIGIGTNTTVFTVINTLILNPLPELTAGNARATDGDCSDPSGQ